MPRPEPRDARLTTRSPPRKLHGVDRYREEEVLGLGPRGRGSRPRASSTGSQRPSQPASASARSASRSRLGSRSSTCPSHESCRSSALEDLFAADPYERAAHAYGKSFRDLVRAFRRDYPHPPDLVAFPRDEADVVTDPRLVHGLAGRRHPLRRRLERRRRRRARRRRGLPRQRQHRPAPPRPRARGRSRSPARRGSREASWARRSRPSSSRTALRFATSRSRSSGRVSAAGSRPARAATSRPSTPTSTSSCRGSAWLHRAECSRPAGCPGRAPDPRRTGCSAAPKARSG